MNASRLAGVGNAWLRPAAPIRSTIPTGRKANAELRTMWSGLPGLTTDCDELRRAVRRGALALNLVGRGAISALQCASVLSASASGRLCSLTVILLNDPTALALANRVT